MKWFLIFSLLSGCSLTTSVHMKCKGECDFETNREVQTTPDLPIPKGDK